MAARCDRHRLVVAHMLGLQLPFELASRVFTLKSAQGVESIRCDQGVRPLLQQRSR